MRVLVVAVAAAGIVVGGATPGLAHGIGGRIDLPVPIWLFVYGAGTAVVLSFVALAALWRSSRLEGAPRGRPLPAPVQPVFRSRAVELAVRALFLGFFVVVVGAGIAGSPVPSENLASIVVYVWLWVGLAFAHALLGNLWATISPLDTLARVLDLGNRPRRAYPAAWGVWPAVVLLLGFLSMELVVPWGSEPTAVLGAIVAYTVVTLAGMAVFGREQWNRHGEAFAVYFGLLARLAPLGRDGEGRVVIRPPLAGLPSVPPRPGIVAFVMVLLGSTTFDGLSASTWWAELLTGLSQAARVLAGLAGLLATIGLMAGLYALAMAGAGMVAGSRWHPLAVRFVHGIVPIAFAYVVAHYFSLLAIEGQLGIRALSDPFAEGWNLLGTAGFSPNQGILTANAIWYVQVGAIVLGHIGGVTLAHDRAIAAFPSDRALRTQYALLVVMVMFTVAGLLILSGA